MPLNIVAVLHIPHSSSYIPEEEREKIILSDELLAVELLKMTDWYTDEIFTSDSKQCQVVRYPVSRLVLDPERFADDSLEIMASRGMGVIYTKTSEGRTLRCAVDSDTRRQMLEKYHAPHHARLSRVVSGILSENGKALVIDCHSFPSSPLPYEMDQDKDRPDVCLGTDPFHTPSWLTEFTKSEFIDRGFSVNIDRPFSGALVPVEFFRKQTAVSGIMIEINRCLYMEETTAVRLCGFENIKRTICDVVSALTQYYRGHGPANKDRS
jgi:N-formylglutamate amidohydrolase